MPFTRYVVGQVVNDQTLGLVMTTEPHQATLNSPEQYTIPHFAVSDGPRSGLHTAAR